MHASSTPAVWMAGPTGSQPPLSSSPPPPPAWNPGGGDHWEEDRTKRPGSRPDSFHFLCPRSHRKIGTVVCWGGSGVFRGTPATWQSCSREALRAQEARSGSREVNTPLSVMSCFPGSLDVREHCTEHTSAVGSHSLHSRGGPQASADSTQAGEMMQRQPLLCTPSLQSLPPSKDRLL